MKWYLISKYDISITAVEAVRETPHQIIYLRKFSDGRTREERASKVSSYHSYYPSFEAARRALMARIHNRVTALKAELDEERKKAAEVFCMEEKA